MTRVLEIVRRIHAPTELEPHDDAGADAPVVNETRAERGRAGLTPQAVMPYGAFAADALREPPETVGVDCPAVVIVGVHASCPMTPCSAS
jgi:hypothetical protein